MKTTVTMLTLLIFSVGCSAARDIKYAAYKDITQNVCIDNEHEVHLAQQLYLYMLGPGHK